MKFIRVTEVSLEPIYGDGDGDAEIKTYSDRVMYFSYKSSPVSHKQMVVGRAFLNPDHIMEVSAEEKVGLGQVTSVYFTDDSYIDVVETVEQVMLQIEGV